MHQCICYETETSLSITFVLRWSCAVDRTLKEKFDSQNDILLGILLYASLDHAAVVAVSHVIGLMVSFSVARIGFLCNPKDYTDTRAQNTENK